MTKWKELCTELMNEAIYLGSLPYDQDPDPELIARARTALAQPEPEAVTDEEKWYPGFADWLEREMPEGTVIGDPLWWASKIADYLQRFARPTIEPVPVVGRPAIAEEAYLAFVQICKGSSDDAGTYDADEKLVRRALKKLSDLERNALPVPGAEVG